MSASARNMRKTVVMLMLSLVDRGSPRLFHLKPVRVISLLRMPESIKDY